MVAGVVFAFVLFFVSSNGETEPQLPFGDQINVWIVAHTHDDTGWLETVDQYYVEKVRWILDTTTQALLNNPQRKFTYVEMAFFARWWEELPNSRRADVLKLIENGQLQINLGGWCMNDEGATTYSADINQMTVGALFAHQSLNTRPMVGWHVDPFGHSAVTPSLWADIGFNAFGINRIDYRIKDAMKANKGLEFVWRGSKSLGAARDMWIHVMDSHYCSPKECAYDANYFVQNDPRLPTYKADIKQEGEAFVVMARERLMWYRHNNLLIPFGCDYAHQNADRSFAQMDELINYVNSNKTLNATVRYGTLNDYTEAVHALNLTWDVYEGDFFPYTTSAQQYWTGYYTSRPQLKGAVRRNSAFLQVAETIYSLASQVLQFDKITAFERIEELRKAVAVVQHHDAVTGTETTDVMKDYELMLHMGNTSAGMVITELLANMVNPQHPPMLSVNGSVLSTLKAGQSVAVVVYNSLGWMRKNYVAVPVNRTDLTVTDSSGKPVPSDVLVNATSAYSSRLYFLATVPPLGFNTYFIHVSNSSISTHKTLSYSLEGDASIENEFYYVTVSGESGRLASIQDKSTGKTLQVHQDLFQYESAAQVNEQASGAYIFRPAQDNRTVVGGNPHSPISETKIGFFNSFSSTPIVLATAYGQDYVDTFTVSTHTVSKTNFTVQAYRVDQSSWTQSGFAVNYWAIPPDGVPQGAMAGSLEVGSSPSATCKTVELTYGKTFSDRPRLLATVKKSESVKESYVASATTVTSQGATFNVCRADGKGWSQTVHLDWLALNSSQNLGKPGVIHNTFTVSKGSRQKVLRVNVSLEEEYPYYAPSIVAFVTSGSRAFTVTGIEKTSSRSLICFNLCNVDLSPWNESLTVDYLLFPRQTIEYPVLSGPVQVSVSMGKYVSEITQIYRKNYFQVIRLYGGMASDGGSSPDLKYIEQEFLVGPLDKGRELVTRYETGLKSANTWFTDDNGLEMQKRVYNQSETERIAGNYYPMIGAAYMQDAAVDEQFTLLAERSHGCTSTKEGMLEVMLHRRCLEDDGLGVGQVLDENIQADPKLWMVYADRQDSAYLHHHLSMQQQFPLTAVFGEPASLAAWTASYKTSFTGLANPLPPNVHLLSFRSFNASSNATILRLEHLFEVDESDEYSKPVQVTLSQLFAPGFSASNPREMALTATASQSEAKREQLQWNVAESHNHIDRSFLVDDGDTITLVPREIRTFLVN
eukprot:m.19488 g.19488  ORF g.19488 m.19488 type:complete len:1215 (+) comp27848_c0_seq1:22-3666(+)